MRKVKIAITDTVFPNLEPTKKALSSLNYEIIFSEDTSSEKIINVAKDSDALFVTYSKITSQIIESLNNCKVIGRFGIGVDNIDIQAATKAGIVVVYVPDYCFDEVSDHALSMILALSRKITFSNSMVQNGHWEMKAVVPLVRLKGQSVGLVGFGNIAKSLTPKLLALGLKVLTYDPFVSNENAHQAGVELVTFEELLAVSDYVSIHAPLTKETTGMFDHNIFKKMKSTSFIINTSRGPLVNTDDLANALDKKEIGGAALDVVPVEPLNKNSPLLGRDNVILTPHTAFYSEDALFDLQAKCAKDVASVINGKRPIYPINPEVIK